MKINKTSEWMEENEPVKRDSISKSALGSFSDIVVKRAKDMKSKGQSYEQIAKSFNINADLLKNMISEDHVKEASSPTCSCMEKEASVKEDKVDPAQEAYESLHGKRNESPEVKNIEARRHIVSADTKDNGGYHKQMGAINQPSIFDPDKLDRTVKEMDNGERIRKENADIESRRTASKNDSRYQTISGDNLKEALKTTLQNKANSVSSVSGSDAHKYSKKLPVSGMSIFDEKEFERVAPSAGEKMIETQKKEASEKKDRSWTENGRKTVTTKDITKSMIDSMLNSKE